MDERSIAGSQRSNIRFVTQDLTNSSHLGFAPFRDSNLFESIHLSIPLRSSGNMHDEAQRSTNNKQLFHSLNKSITGSELWNRLQEGDGASKRQSYADQHSIRSRQKDCQLQDVPDLLQKHTTSSVIIAQNTKTFDNLYTTTGSIILKGPKLKEEDVQSNESELHSTGSKRKKKQNKPTKNLLRDFAKNFHEYALYSPKAAEQLQMLYHKRRPDGSASFQEVLSLFRKDVERLRDEHNMVTFGHYQTKWKGRSTFDFYYRYLTMHFYLHESPCYFYKSKVKNKSLYIEYLCNFIAGVRNPNKFDRFDNSNRSVQ